MNLASDQWSGRRLVGVFPHPDDEAYAAGGLLALAARAGASVSILCATRGDAGRARTPDSLPRPLGERRAAELAASCRALGAGPPLFLGIDDGQVAGAGEVVTEVLADLLIDLRPHVVITLGRDGVYGHRDHTACTEWVARATEPLADVRVLHAQFPRAHFAALRRALRKRRAAALDPAVGADDLGIDRANADLRVDIRAARAAKLAAIGAHASQLADGSDPHTFLMPGLVDALLDEEWYTLASGPPLPAGATEPFS